LTLAVLIDADRFYSLLKDSRHRPALSVLSFRRRTRRRNDKNGRVRL